MTLSNTRIIPELQYWFNYFIVHSAVNKYNVPKPASISPDLFMTVGEDQSFIRLLFDDNWPSNLTSYRYLYREIESSGSWPSPVRERGQVYPGSTRYYICDSDNTSVCTVNVFNLKQDDIILLNKLLQYRIDSTSVVNIGVVYGDLKTNLSKLIYRFLDLKINKSYLDYLSSSPIADEDKVLECCYEVYVADKMFAYVSGQNL